MSHNNKVGKEVIKEIQVWIKLFSEQPFLQNMSDYIYLIYNELFRYEAYSNVLYHLYNRPIFIGLEPLCD